MRPVAVLALLALAAPAIAVPVNPNAPDQIAAVYWSSFSCYVLRTNGELWSFSFQTGWEQQSGDLASPLPVPLAEIADWELYALVTQAGERWILRGMAPGGWAQLPPPPFAPVPGAARSLGNVKGTYR